MLPDEFINPDASELINDTELEELINKLGGFLTIVTNKPISCVTFFLLIQKNEKLRDVLVELADTSWYSIVEYLAHRYPVLNKSKKIK